jgi:uncharacterized protein YigA (DUF484 family)
LDRPKDKSILSAPRKHTGLADVGPVEVATYLRQNAGFLAEHPDLLQILTPPAQRRGEGVVDMQQFMLQRLQTEVARLKNQHRALITTSRANLATQARIHQAVLALLAAPSFEHLIQIVTTDFAVLLDADVITLAVESVSCGQSHLSVRGVQLLERGTVESMFGPDRDVLLLGDAEGDPAVFGGGAGLVRSAALLRLKVSPQAPAGLLAIGSRRTGKFHAGQGTELLGFLAKSLSIVIAGWLDLPV